MKLIKYNVPLLPFIKIREEAEVSRAARGRSERTRKIKRIPVRFPSVNNMYPLNPGGRTKRLSSEGRLYKDYIYDVLSLSAEAIPSWDYFDCTYVFNMTYEMMFTKSGDLKRVDVSNFIKATEDAIFDFLLEDDKAVTGVRGYKRLTDRDPFLLIILSEGSITGQTWHQGIIVE